VSLQLGQKCSKHSNYHFIMLTWVLKSALPTAPDLTFENCILPPASETLKLENTRYATNKFWNTYKPALSHSRVHRMHNVNDGLLRPMLQYCGVSVSQSVCLSLSVKPLRSAKAAERIKILFQVDILRESPTSRTTTCSAIFLLSAAARQTDRQTDRRKDRLTWHITVWDRS